MTDIYIVKNKLTINGMIFKCAYGKNGFTDKKIEGDNCTPIGSYTLRRVFYRADKITTPVVGGGTVPIAINEFMGWADDKNAPQYNTMIEFPYSYSAEKMYRDDDVYDVIVEIGYNDSPPIAGRGSAIFFHIARADYTGTEGCVAVKLEHMLQILPLLTKGSVMHIKA